MKQKKNFFLPYQKILSVFSMLCLLFHCGFAQGSGTLNGTVHSSVDNSPLMGVSVRIKGKNTGTATDAAGHFSIKAEKGSTIIFSSVGYQDQEFVTNGQLVADIKLQPADNSLDQVVVVGYGSKRKKDITAAVSVINVSDIGEIPAQNVTQLIQGQAAGVTVKQTTGAPGREFEVTVRGLGSLGAGSQPLYVVDGFAVGTSIGPNLNPNDIETITILKDAVSTAIYGARGSNGVVLITTKHAKAGKTNLNVTADYGIQNIPNSRRTKVLNGVEFAQFKKDIFMDKIRYFENREPDIEEVPIDFRYPEQTKFSTNWFNEILNQNASFQNYNITLSEGSGDIHSLVSVGYMGQEGALKKTNYNNYSLRANIGGKLNKFINMELNLNGSYSKQNVTSSEGRAELVGSTLLMDPREPVYKEDGSYNSYIGGHDGIFGFPNPVQSLNQIMRLREIGDLLSNGFLEISFLKNFKFKTAVNARLNYNSYKSFVPSTMAGVNAPPPNNASEYDDAFRTMNLSADQLLTYSNEFGPHHFDVLAGYTAQIETVKGLSGSGNQYPDDLVPFLNAAILKSAGSTEYGWSMVAFLSRLNYSYKDKYLFSATFRREGSSRFGSKNKYGNFPAMSVGWRISDEPFMPKYSWLTDLKLRGSWGITGNNNIGNYSSLSFMNTNNYILGNNFASGKVISSFANSQLGWEKSDQIDIGLDFSAFNNKLTFTAEYYKKITSDMLLSIQLPAISGFTSSLANVGKVQNNGFEFAVDYKIKLNQVGLRSNFNISFNRNKVLAIRGENDEIWNGSMYGDYNVSKVGRPIGMIYGFKMLGIFNNQAEIDKSPTQDGAIPGVYKFWDANGDGVISYDQTDMVEIGNPFPKFTWGWTIAGDYKKFDLNIMFLGAQKYDVFRQIESSTMNMDGVFNVSVESKDRWRSEANPGKGKQGTTNTWKWARESSSRYVYDASHLWLKNVTLGYTLPVSRTILSNARVFLSAYNLLLITKYPGNNPDVNMNGGINPGLDDEAYPVSRTFSAGINLTF